VRKAKSTFCVANVRRKHTLMSQQSNNFRRGIVCGYFTNSILKSTSLLKVYSNLVCISMPLSDGIIKGMKRICKLKEMLALSGINIKQKPSWLTK